MIRKTLLLVFALTVALATAGISVAQEGTRATVTGNSLNVRSMPDGDVIGEFKWGAEVVIEARDSVNYWVLIHALDYSLRGWVSGYYLDWDPFVAWESFPVSDEVVVAGVIPAPAADAAPPAASDTGTTPDIEAPVVLEPEILRDWSIDDPRVVRLMQTPVLPTVSARMRQVYQKGQRLGMEPGVFAKVGDCHTANDYFLIQYGFGNYDLGPFPQLQDTLDYYATKIDASGGLNAFARASVAADSGFSAGAVADPIWANQDFCEWGEAPLACEYRLIHPSVAIVMFGAVDIKVDKAEVFEMYLRNVVTWSIDQGVVPVLNTFPAHPEYMGDLALTFNNIVLDVAQAEQVPVINLWRAMLELPNYGLMDDNYHMNGDGVIHLWEVTTGNEMRNLVTLQALDILRTQLR